MYSTDIDIMRNLSKQELDLLPYDVLKWHCCCKGCKNSTTVRDYGVSPYYFLNRNSKEAQKHPLNYWNNLNVVYWFCKHYQFLKRLGGEYMFEKYADKEKEKIGILVKKVNYGIEQIKE